MGSTVPRGGRLEDGRTASALPCNMALASSFDRELAEEYGKVIAEECIENGIQIILGPGINLMRTPMNGRNFEYMGEDPVLAGQIAAGYVRGCQSEGVAACPKHLALNNQEHCRTISDSRCDWNTIKELYLEAFRIVIEETSPWTIMSSIAQSATEGDRAKTSKRRKAQKLLCRENHALHSTKCDGGRPRKENRKDQQICFTPTLSAASTIQVNDISAVPVIYVSG